PDFHTLYNDLAPIDKYGQIQVTRNNIKSVRSASLTLLKRAQLLLRDQSLSEALSIFEAVLTHLHKLHAKIPQFQEQLMVELKLAYRLFELLCSQSMAPRLQQRSMNLSIDVCSRESYIFPMGMRPLIHVTENFFLEEKNRREAFAIAEQKLLSGSTQSLKWIALLYHWRRIWNLKASSVLLRNQMERSIPDIIRDLSNQGEHEDVLFIADLADKSKYDLHAIRNILQAALRSARSLGEKERMVSYASELAMHYLDSDAWDLLYEIEQPRALHVLNIIDELYSPSSDQDADRLLLHGWSIAGNGAAVIRRLENIGDFQLIMEFDQPLKEKFREELEWVYARHIHAIRDAYGGIIARQKLNNIFSHLKSMDLFGSVGEKIKLMEKPKQVKGESQKIKGFVFDLDGVIVDTAVHHFQSWKKILRELGAEITENDDHHTRGAGRMESLEYLLDKYEIDLTNDEKLFWAAKKNDVYLEAIESITPSDILPGAYAFLQESRKMGLSLALGSASKNAGTVLEKLGIIDKFDAIVDGNDTKASKPDPEIFIKACAAINLDPSSVVVFEDAPKGIQAALSAGCKAVGIGEQVNLSAAHIVVQGLNKISPLQVIEQLA
ncbi:MAG TPA: beta-phosphoglucomutase, partial [Saprospiraceae bacterium]|nr:beta-phosphoglucomutase [Saprospiraceae bacterium]